MSYDASHHIGAYVGLYFVSAILGFTLVFAIRSTASANWFRNLMENGKVLTSMTKSRDNAIQRMTPGTVQVQGVTGSVLCAIIGIEIGSRAVETARDSALAFIGAIAIFAAGLCLAFGVAFWLSPRPPRTSRRAPKRMVLLLSSAATVLALAGATLAVCV
ncbi:hypothetical protein OR221_2351 [Microbacterium laevaniformans OR221]|nr:hypothetical protein OR221_2351 [Microbacterium laevaniformans OR221]